MLQNLYRLKSLGYCYSDPFITNATPLAQQLPDNIEQLHQLINSCHLCDLSKSRQQSMSGSGNIHADLMIVDAYVSMSEDSQNAYFVGNSGETLVKMVENVLKVPMRSLYFTHAIKCKPLGSNQPSDSEFSSCKPYLYKQIELIKPKIVIALGEEAYQLLSGDDTPFEQVRGQRIKGDGYTIIPIFHPQYLMRNPSKKGVTLQDLTMIKSYL